MKVYQALQETGVSFEFPKHIPFAGCGLNSETKHARVDFSIAKEWGHVILEVDEDQHRSYPIGCDVRRDFCIHESVTMGSGHKLRVIHYNPDAFRVDGKACATTQKDRIAKLLAALEEDEPVGFERLFIFFDSVSGATLPQVGASWDQAVQEVSRVFW